MHRNVLGKRYGTPRVTGPAVQVRTTSSSVNRRDAGQEAHALRRLEGEAGPRPGTTSMISCVCCQ